MKTKWNFTFSWFKMRLFAQHYSKSQIFVQKKSILTKLYNFLGKSKLSTTKKCKSPTFSPVFYPIFFWQFFSWNQSCQQLKSAKSTTSLRDFHLIYFSTFFLVKSKLSTSKKCQTQNINTSFSFNLISTIFSWNQSCQ